MAYLRTILIISLVWSFFIKDLVAFVFEDKEKFFYSIDIEVDDSSEESGKEVEEDERDESKINFDPQLSFGFVISEISYPSYIEKLPVENYFEVDLLPPELA